MNYDVYLFRKEVKEQHSDLRFVENGDPIPEFTKEQFEKLKRRLLAYKFQIENENADSISFNFKGGLYGIRALLTKSQLSFASGFSENGIFEKCVNEAVGWVKRNFY